MVFVHGTRTSSSIWKHQMDAVLGSGHDAVAVDLPGHGARSDERFTFRGALEAIDHAVESFPVPPLLVGLSLGGYTSLAYAARHQHKVAGVVLSGCSTEIKGKPLGLYRHVSTQVVRALRPTESTWHVVTDMLGALKGYSSLRDLRRLVVPVWLVNGQMDPLRLEEWRYRLALPTARLHVVPRAGHDVNSHAPEVFNRILFGALHELRSAAEHLAPHRLAAHRVRTPALV